MKTPVLKKIYGMLEIPWIYCLAGEMLAPGWRGLTKPFYRRIFDHPSQRVLDFGCGPALHTPEPNGLLVGVDVNESYVRKYSGGFLDEDPTLFFSPPESRRRFGYMLHSDQLPFNEGSFDEARTCAVFHHLTDQEVNRALREMSRCLQSGGRLVIVDLVWPLRAWARPLAWVTLSLDRGRYMRRQEELLELCQAACPGHWNWERHTVTYTGMEFLCLQQVKA